MQTFSEYISARHGPSWCVSARKTPALLARYGAVIPRKQYKKLELAWEVETYGAPLKALERTAPALLSTLRAIVNVCKDAHNQPRPAALADTAYTMASAAIAQVEAVES